MHFDQNIVFIIVAAIIGISRLVARIAENKREQSQRRSRPPSRPIAEPSTPPAAITTPKTDEQRVREFLEALGAPVGTAPPPKIRPRVDLPPRPIAPVAPPPFSRPFSPTFLKPVAETARRIFAPPTAPAPAQTLAPAERDPSGEWLLERQQVAERAAKFEDATRAAQAGLLGETEVASQAAGSGWNNALRTRDSIRTAFVLREILGPPRALREMEPV